MPHFSVPRRRALLALLCSIAAVPVAAHSQTRDLESLALTIEDATGARLSGAHVELLNPQTKLRREGATDSQGQLRFAGLPTVDSYDLHVSAPGFRDADRTALALRPGTNATLTLTLLPGSATAEVTVYGTAGSIQTSSDEVGTRLQLAKIENTSLLNNRVTSLVLLDSSVRPAYTTGDLFTNETLFVVNGGGRRQTSWSIDNVNADESWGRQTIFTSVPQVAIQEFQLLADAIPAEFGWTSGSAVSIVTKAGSNAWHGDLLGTGRPAFSEASAPLAIAKATNTLAQGDASLNGPIVRDRTWFNAAAEYSSQTRAAVITSPLAYGSFFNGQFDQALFFLRLDHQLNRAHRLALRLLGDHFTDTNPADAVSGSTLPTAARTFVRGTYAVNLSDVSNLGPNTTNEARIQFHLAGPVTRFTPVLFGPQIFATGFYTYGDSRIANLMNHQYEAAETLSHQAGRHTLIAGAEFIRSSSGGIGQEFGGGYTQGRFQVNARYATLPIATVLASNPGVAPSGQPAGSPTLVSAYTEAFGNQSYNVKELLSAAFFEDDWKVASDLTLNLGLRYEQQTFLGDNNNLAPRLGLAWHVPVPVPVSLRAGYGIFYSEVPANLAAGYSLGDPRGVFSFSSAPGQCGFPTSFTPFANLPSLLASPACAANGSQAIPLRSLTVNVGQAAYLNQYLSVANLRAYPTHLLNPYTQQWNLGTDLDLGRHWILSADYIGTRGLKIIRAIELNPPSTFLRTAPGQVRSVAAANATRPLRPASTCTLAGSSFAPAIANCFNNYTSIQAQANAADAYFEGVTVKLERTLGTRLAALLTYTLSHTINTYEQDASGGNPNDWNSLTEAERASGTLDQRHHAALSGTYRLPLDVTLGGVAQLSSGLPFNPITGVDDNGDGSTTDRPVVNGHLLGRNAGRSSSLYSLDTSLQKTLVVREHLQISLRAEAFNVLNHANFYTRNGTYGDGLVPSTSFGAPVGGLASTGPARQMQFLMRVRF